MKTKMCYFFERGKCASSNCRYAHSKTELRHQPNLQKTKLCKTFAQEGRCLEGENCVFAHGESELKHTDGIYKTQMCHFYERGRCLKGDRCNHAHGPGDMRGGSANAAGAGAGGRSAPKGALHLSEMLVDSAMAQVPFNPLDLASHAQIAAVAQAAAAISAGLLTSSDYGGLGLGAPPLWGMPWGMPGYPGSPVVPPMPGFQPPHLGSPAARTPLGCRGRSPPDDCSTGLLTTPLGTWSRDNAEWLYSSPVAKPFERPRPEVTPLNLSERLNALGMVVDGFSNDVSSFAAAAAAGPQKHIHRI